MRKRFVVARLALVAAALWAAQGASATVFNYSVLANGPSENPVNASAGIGNGTVVYNDVAHTLGLTMNFSGLTGTVTQTHFHATTTTSGLTNPPSSVANAGIAIGNTTLPLFPLGVTSGTYSNTLNLTDASIYTAAFLTASGGTAAGAESAFAAALSGGRTYWNIHTSTSPGGEIRGFPALVPEPATLGLASMAALALLRRRRK